MICRCDVATKAQIKAMLAPVLNLRGKARQDKLASLGYAISKDETHEVLTTLPHGVRVCELR